MSSERGAGAAAPSAAVPTAFATSLLPSSDASARTHTHTRTHTLGTELSSAAYDGDLVRVQALLDPDVPLPTDAEGRTALHWACAGGRENVVSFLLHTHTYTHTHVHEAVNARDSTGWTPLMLATAAGSLPIISSLLEAGADPSLRNGAGQNATHVHKGRAHTLTGILTHVSPAAAAAIVNTQDMRGVTPLHKAAGPGFVEVISALLAAGARVRIPDAAGNTPLHVACEEGRVDAVRLLVDADGGEGPGVPAARTRNAEGFTPIQMCHDPRARATLASVLAAAE